MTGARVHVRNVGGIEETTVALAPGVSVLVGRNATNRTSLLRSLIAALGGENVSLRAGADEGRVELTVDGETYTRRLRRRDGEGGPRLDGDPYLDDPESARLFAFLLEDNEARRAVARGADLRDLAVRPVDTAAIEAEIGELTAEKGEIDDRLEELDRTERALTERRRERDRLEGEIDERREELADLEAAVEATEGPAEGDRGELAERLSDLGSARDELEELRFRLETERESLASLREERAELRAELDDVEEPAEDPAAIERRLSELRERRRSLDATVSELQSVVEFNRAALAEGIELGSGGDDGADGTAGESSPVAELAPDGETECWTCGTTVPRSEIEATIGRLESLRETKLDERDGLRERIDQLRERERAADEARERRRSLERSVERTEAEIERREATVAELADRRDELEERVGELEAAVADADGDDEYATLVERHGEATRLEFELERREEALADATAAIDRLERDLDERATLADRREEIADRLATLRTRIADVERGVVERFNEHMTAVLEALSYDNVERIWIERRTADEGAGTTAGPSPDSTFVLHVVRTTGDGEGFEDTVGNLSESERAVTGLVFALAGYLVHEVYEAVPFVLLDSLEAIDAERIGALVEYFADYADYLVVALLPEDAAAVDDRHERVREI